MSLRPATKNDEALFLYWRARAEREGREGGWYQGQATTKRQHHHWYQDRLQHATLLVWTPFPTKPAGVARIDTNGEIAFHADPKVAPLLLDELKPYALEHGGRLKATIDHGNTAAAKALEQAGFREYPVRFFCYRP